MSVGLLAGTCDDPDNAPPNAPRFRIAEYDATTITGVFDNQCRDDGKPDGKCQQWVIITGGDQQARSYKATNGAVLIENRKPATAYDLFPYHTDTQKRTNGETSYGFKTSGTSGPQVLGVTPTEIVVPSTEVTINGRDFTPGLTARLVDPTTNVSQTLSITGVAPNRLTVSVPKPVGLTKREPYFIVLGTNNKVHAKADIVYLNPDPTTRPAGQEIQLSFIRWQPSGYCDGFLCRDCRLIDAWEPNVRAFWGSTMGTLADPDDFWLDLWSDPVWEKWKTHLEDSGLEWSAMCSEAWGAGGKHIRGIFEVGAGRVTMPSGRLYWTDLDLDSHDVEHLALRLRFDSNLNHRDFCAEDALTSTTLPRRVPDDCVKWQPNQAGRINVHLVGAFYEAGREVDPNDMRAISKPGSSYTTNTNGMILISDNPFLNARLKTKPAPPGANGCYADDIQNQEDSIWHWYLSASDPIRQIHWWGPREGRSTEPTPNLLSHELHHVLTGYVHDLRGDFPDPCYTPAVGQPTTECPRGFNMTLTGELDAYSQCGRALDTSYTN